MKLSDAIALGRMVVRPVAGAEYHYDGSGCARGMALEAIGARTGDPHTVKNFLEFELRWPWTNKKLLFNPCSCPPDGQWSISVWITHLFDDHVMQRWANAAMISRQVWTLDQLIDWVRSVEPADLPAEPLAAAPAEQQAMEALVTVPGPISL